MRLHTFYGIVLLFLTPAARAQQQAPADSIRYVPRIYQPFDIGAVKPAGWLLDQLKTVASNSTGHLDETHDKIKKDN